MSSVYATEIIALGSYEPNTGSCFVGILTFVTVLVLRFAFVLLETAVDGEIAKNALPLKALPLNFAVADCAAFWDVYNSFAEEENK